MREDVLILNAGDITSMARHLRDVKLGELEQVQPIALRRAAQLLRAGAYSAQTAARRFERVASEVEARG